MQAAINKSHVDVYGSREQSWTFRIGANARQDTTPMGPPSEFRKLERNWATPCRLPPRRARDGKLSHLACAYAYLDERRDIRREVTHNQRFSRSKSPLRSGDKVARKWEKDEGSYGRVQIRGVLPVLLTGSCRVLCDTYDHHLADYDDISGVQRSSHDQADDSLSA